MMFTVLLINNVRCNYLFVHNFNQSELFISVCQMLIIEKQNKNYV